MKKGNFLLSLAFGILASLIGSVFVTSSALAGSAALSWNANGESDLASYKVYYGAVSKSGATPCANAGYTSSVNVGNVTSYTISNLTDGQTYYFAISAIDSSGNESACSSQVSKTLTIIDTTAPVISGVTASSITTTGATITWTTNENSDTQAEYGLTPSYGSQTTLNSSLVTAHSQTLSGLTANTHYHYRVKSRDAAGNLASSTDQSFTTVAVAEATAPIVSAPASSSGGGGGGGGSFVLTCSTPTIVNGTVTAYPGCAIVCNSGFALINGACVLPFSSSSTATSSVSANTTTNTINSGTTVGNTTNSGVSGANNVISNTPSFSASVVITGPFSVGMQSDQVKKLQEILSKDKAIYPEGMASGYYGGLTVKAVQRFQCQHLSICSGSPDSNGYGLAGPATRVKISAVFGSNIAAPSISFSSPSSTSTQILISTSTPIIAQTPVILTTVQVITGPFSVGMQSDQVKKLQEILSKDKAIYPEGMASGYYGGLTVKAVQRFQCQHLSICSGSPDSNGYGLAGPGTRKKINEIFGGNQTQLGQTQTSQATTQSSPSQQSISALQEQLNKLLEQIKALQGQ